MEKRLVLRRDLEVGGGHAQLATPSSEPRDDLRLEPERRTQDLGVVPVLEFFVVVLLVQFYVVGVVLFLYRGDVGGQGREVDLVYLVVTVHRVLYVVLSVSLLLGLVVRIQHEHTECSGISSENVLAGR